MQTGIANLVHSAFIIASCHCVSRISRKWMLNGGNENTPPGWRAQAGCRVGEWEFASDSEPDQPL
jgi:hypothetical protein